MSKRTILLFVSIWFLALDSGFCITLRFKRDEKCADNTTLSECPDPTGGEGWPQFPRAKTNHLHAIFTTSCKFDHVKFRWLLYDQFSNDTLMDVTTNNVLVFLPFALKKGFYAVEVYMKITRNGKIETTLGQPCPLEVTARDPIASIRGGTERTAEADHGFTVDGSPSVDRDVAPHEKAKLSYKWTCRLLEGTSKGFCDRQYEGSVLHVPAESALRNHKYLFVLNVKDEKSDWVSTDQTVIVLAKVSELEIICDKNCAPLASETNNKRSTYLRVKCLKGCIGVDKFSYEWTIEGGTIDYHKDTLFGRHYEQFIIKKDVLESGKKYTVRVKLQDRNGTAVRVLEVHKPIEIESCQVVPSEGIALETLFSVSCKYTGDGHSFEVFTRKSDKSVVLTKRSKIESLKFMLPTETDAFIKIVDVENVEVVFKLNVNVKPSTKPLTNVTNSMKHLAKTGDIDTMVQITNGLIETNQTDQQLKQSLIENLNDVTMKSHENARQLASIVTRLVHEPGIDSNPYQGEIASEICKRASEINLEYLKKELDPVSSDVEVEETTRTLMMCTETDSKENFKALEPIPSDFQITTPFPMLTLPVIEEQYPDYIDDETVTIKRKKYESISASSVSICENNLKMMSLTVVEGEDTKVVATDECSIHVTRRLGKDLIKNEIKIEGGSLQPSRDFEGVDDPVDVLVCSWKKDPFWWNPPGTVTSTNIFLIKITRNDKEIKEFRQPNRIILDQLKHQNFHIHDIAISNGSVLRIDVKKRETFTVKFHELKEPLTVTISYFDKPEPSQVRKEGKIISGNESVLYQEHDHDFDSWYYITTVPESGRAEFEYQISVFTKSCYSWNSLAKEWEFACKGGSNSGDDKIHCPCTHLSILAGAVYDNPVRIDEITTAPDFEMVLMASSIILATVGTIFVLYCLMIVLGRKGGVKGVKIYIPADISTDSRYVYLVAIQTGRKISSGTSSSICMKIFGEKRSSQSHVLNYPDPQKRIFQRGNQDWFLVPTLNSLGNVNEIALWSDYTGRHPPWYCHKITVHDLQSHQNWYFRVKAWFELPPNGQIYVRSRASERKQKRRRFGAIFWRIFPKRTHQDGFTKLRQLTLLLSIFLMICLSCLVLYGTPRFHRSDGFAMVEEFHWYYFILWIGLTSSIVTFIIHGVLIWLFRKYSWYCWFVLIFMVVSSMTILVVFGFWVPMIIGCLWSLSVIIASIFYFFFLENVYELILNLFYHKNEEKTSWIYNRKILGAIESQRTYLFRKFGENLLRSYFTHLYQPLDATGIKERRLHMESKRNFFVLVEDTVMFTCYITLLYLAIFANKNPLEVVNHQEMINLLSGSHTGTKSFARIESIEDIYDYINTTLIPTIHAVQWYQSYVVNDPGMLADFHNKLLGVARLRQKRTIRTPCKLLEIFKNETCRLEFWQTKQNKSTFGVEYNWARLSDVWNHTDASIAGHSVCVGKFGIYLGDGFVAPLGRTWFNSYANLAYLRNNSWLDEATAAVMIEFLVYNVNSNLFNAVTIVLERSASGYLRSRLQLDTSHMVFVKNEQMFAQVIIFSFFILVLVMFTVKFLARVFRRRFLVFGDLWILVDFVIVGMSYGCFVLLKYGADKVGDFLDRIDKAKKNEFIDYFGVIYEQVVFKSVASLLVFIATVRLWKVFRFGTVFKVMEKTVFLSFFPIVIIIFFNLIFIIGFSLVGNIIFGYFSPDFKDIPDTLITLMLLFTGLQDEFDFRTLLDQNPILGKFFYSTYMLLSQLFLTIYVAVINYYYYKAKTSLDESDFKRVKRFLYKELLFYRTYMKVGIDRLKGGTLNRRNLIRPKSDEFRYANCMTCPLNDLELMRCAALYELKKSRMTEKERIKLMHQVVRCSCGGDEIDIFYAEKSEYEIIKIVHDGRVRRVAAAARMILSFGDTKRERAEKRYRKITSQQLNKLDFIIQVLNIAMRVVSNIEIQ